MTESEFERLLSQSESTTLDFKRDQYDFTADRDNQKTAKFVKDIISLSNTIRTESAFIIVGVQIKDDGNKELLGIKENIDDSIFQEKIKDKAFPIPKFSYETIKYNGLIFGVFEVPISRYDSPITPIIKLRGLNPGQFYFRRGSSNSEANSFESINIGRWMSSLSESLNSGSLIDSIYEIINKLTNKSIPVSQSISDSLILADKYNVKELKIFCENELSDWKTQEISTEFNENPFSYRICKVVSTYGRVEIPNIYNSNSRVLINHIGQLEGAETVNMFMNFSITTIEYNINKLTESPNTIVQIRLTVDRNKTGIFDNTENRHVYLNKDNFENIYENIRQKLIDILMKVR